MARRTRSVEEAVAEAVQENFPEIVDATFDFATDAVRRGVDAWQQRQRAGLSPEQLAGTFQCASQVRCQPPHQFRVYEMQMIDPRPAPDGTRFGMCKPCFEFMWQAGVDKLKILAQHAARNGGARKQASRTAAIQPPWETLGVDRDATEEQIKKAYKREAAKVHPDIYPPGTSDEDKAAMRQRFEDLGRARDAMLKVRKAAT